jgi:predicted amidophosphoribosyltransferase
MTPAIRRLVFGSCYVYSPAGVGKICEHSRLMRSLLKEADARFIERYASRVNQQVGSGASALRGFFGNSDILVPIPGCAPETQGRPWVAAQLANALVRQGLGCAMWPGLRRIHAVRKSACALIGSRPTIQRHYESFSLGSPLWKPDSLVLIDDIVTKGRTLMAAAVLLKEQFPDAHVRAFALVRTMGQVDGVDALLRPCRGGIRFCNGEAYRYP